MANETNATPQGRIMLAAVDRFLETHIVTGEELETRGYRWVCWGADNAFPDYLRELVDSVPSLGSIINGCVDYCIGDGVELAPQLLQGSGIVNRQGETITDLARRYFRNFWTYGGTPLEIILKADGTGPAEVNALDTRFIRATKELDLFWYSEEWASKYARKSKAIEMPKWSAGTQIERTVHLVKTTTDRTYPSPVYASALVACDIERRVSRYHLNAIANGFSSSYFISLNNGVPMDEQKAEIERDLNQKLGGDENAGRIVIGFSDDRAHSPIFQKLDHDDWGTRYQSLEKYSRAQIFTAFRANPNLFGLPTESLGFSDEEYASAFALFNRTMIRPAQRQFCDAMDRVLGVPGAVTIKPFTLNLE